MKLFKKEDSLLVFFSSFQMMYQFSVYLVVPFFSVILLSANWSEEQITYFFSIASFTVFLFSPAIGRISDFYSKKTIMTFGLVTQALFFLVYFFLSHNIILMYIARIIEMIGFICIAVVGLSAFEDLIKEKRGFWTGFFMTLGTMGALLGPIIAGFISENYANNLLLLLGAVASVVAVTVLIFLPISTSKKKTSPTKFTLKQLNPLSEISHFIENKKMRGMALLGLITNARGQIFTIFFPIYILKTMGFSETYLGFLLTIPILTHLFQSYLGKLADAISPQFGILFGLFLSSSALFFFPYLSTLTHIIIVLIVMGIGNSIWNVSAWSLMGDYAKKYHVEGEIVGTYFSLSKLGAFLATLSVSTILTFFTIGIMIQIFAILLLIACIFAYFLFEPIFHHEKTKNHFVEHFSK